MGLRSWVRSLFSRPAAPEKTRRVRGYYDNAQTTTENEEHWSWADGLNANAANSPEVRRTLRERARYEAENGGYCGGLIEKLGNALVGACPRLQVQMPATYTDPDFGVAQPVSPEAARTVEALFAAWAKRVGLGQKLRLIDNAATRDGEGFGLLITNPALPDDAPQLDVRLYETDQVETPFFDWYDPLAFSGGRIDEAGNVVEWHFLKAHPGSNVWNANVFDYDRIPAERVLHWYKPKRAGQLRGVPEIGSSLSLFGVLRRYTKAVLGAAETAASIAGVLETELAAGASAPTVATMDEVPIPHRALLTLPAGQKAKAFDGTQPTTEYGAFKGEVLTEAGQPVNATRNVVTGSSAEYNYSSGRLDHGIFQDGIRVRRSDFATAILDAIFREWIAEAGRIAGYLPEGLPPLATWSVGWRFSGFVSLDPVKDATTDDLRLKNGTTTYAEIYAERGEDWEEAFEQQARELARRKQLGLPTAQGASPPPAPEPEAANAAA